MILEASSILIALPIGALSWAMVYFALQRLHPSITPELSERLCALANEVGGCLLAVQHLTWPLDFARGNEPNTQWQQHMILFFASYYLYDMSHYLFTAPQIHTSIVIRHHVVDLLSAVVGYHFQMFGYAGAVTVVVMEGPHALDEVRRLLKMLGCREHWMYVRYALVAMVVILFNRLVVYTYVVYGFVVLGEVHVALMVGLLAQYLLSLNMCKMYGTFLFSYWSKMMKEE